MTGVQTCALPISRVSCIGRWNSQPLDHQGNSRPWFNSQILIPVYSGPWGESLFPSGPYFFTCKMRRKETFHNDLSGSNFLIDHLEASVLISHEDLRVSLDVLFLINSVTLAQVLTSPPSQKLEPTQPAANICTVRRGKRRQ